MEQEEVTGTRPAYLLVAEDSSDWHGYYMYVAIEVDDVALNHPDRDPDVSVASLCFYVEESEEYGFWHTNEGVRYTEDPRVWDPQHLESEIHRILDESGFTGFRAVPISEQQLDDVLDGNWKLDAELRAECLDDAWFTITDAHWASGHTPPVRAFKAELYGTHSEINRAIYNGQVYIQLEHDELGDEAPYVIIDTAGRITTDESRNNIREDLDDLFDPYGDLPSKPRRPYTPADPYNLELMDAVHTLAEKVQTMDLGDPFQAWSCSEIEALAEVFTAAAEPDAAQYITQQHSQADDIDDMHYPGERTSIETAPPTQTPTSPHTQQARATLESKQEQLDAIRELVRPQVSGHTPTRPEPTRSVVL